MEQLATLSPAETLLMLQGNDASHKELLKVTFMDLLLKQVVTTFTEEHQPSSYDPVQHYKYVEPGIRFSAYEPLPHENAFLAPFQKSNTLRILFRHLVKIGFQNSVSEDYYKKLLIKSPNLERYFSRNLFQKIFGGFSLTGEGLALRKKLQTEIADLEKLLPGILSGNPRKGFDILKLINGNVLLLTTIKLDWLMQLHAELVAALHQQHEEDAGGGFVGCTWGSFDDYSGHFDSSCDSDSGDSGCGGSDSSGCSSGCGGD